MRPPRLRPWMLVSAAWIIPAVLGAIDAAGQRHVWGGRFDLRAVLFSSLDWLLYGAFVPVIFRIAHRWPIARPHIRSRLALHVVASLLFCVARASAGTLIKLLLQPDSFTQGVGKFYASWVLTTLPFGAAVYLAVVGIEHAIAYFAQVNRLSEQLSSAKLTALQAQLNPHFLFNSLNTVAVLVRDGDANRATRVIEQLSDVLRSTLGRPRGNEVSLDDELELVRQYLAVEQARFSDRLRTEINVDPALLSAAVPSFAVQHLVENAVRHGIANRSDAGRILIRATRNGPMLEILVEDDGAGVATESPKLDGHGIQNTLVASEFALALVLLIGTGLMIRSLIALQRVDPGFDPRGVVAMTVSTTGTPAADSSRHAQFYIDALARVKNVPGVASASYINHLPIAGDQWGFPFRVEGRPIPRPGESPTATYRVVFPRYFATMRLPILSGRDIAESDRLGAPPVVVINEFMAKTHWPNENPIGKRIAIGDSTWTTVVGIAKNAVRGSWSAPPEEEMYLSFFQQPRYLKGGYMTLVVRRECSQSCDAATLATTVRGAVRSVEHNAPISAVQTMTAVVSDATADQRFYLVVLASFSAIAIVLAAVGIYGVMSYAVARRTHEIGIRIALGAESVSLVISVVRQAMIVACMGAGAGLLMAFALTRLMRGVLFGVSPTDVTTFVGVTAALLAVALSASLVPARRATRIDPLRALRAN